MHMCLLQCKGPALQAAQLSLTCPLSCCLEQHRWVPFHGGLLLVLCNAAHGMLLLPGC